MRRHVESCVKYLKELRKQIATSLRMSNAGQQLKLTIPRMTAEGKHEFDILYAKIPLLNSYIFSMFECEDMITLFHKALPAYKMPTRHAIAGPRLKLCTQEQKKKSRAI